jgi:hypothetical protein
MTPSARTRPFPGAWPSRPCFPRRTLSRVRIPGPSPLRSLYSVRHTGPVSRPGQRVLRPASASAVHRRMLIGRSSQSQPAFPGGCRRSRVMPGHLVLAGRHRVPTSQDIRSACRHQAVPASAAPAGTPDGAAPCQSTPGWDAGMHPGQASALADRERARPRLPLGEANQTWPRGSRILRTSGSLARAGRARQAADAVWPFCPKLTVPGHLRHRAQYQGPGRRWPWR